MGVGDHPVVPALPDVDGDRDRPDVEPPRLDERQVVVEPAPETLAQGLAARRGAPLGECAGEGGTIHLVDQVAERVRDLGSGHGPEGRPGPVHERRQGFRALERRVELLDVLGSHVGEERVTCAIPPSPNGATDATAATARTRSASRAAQARACGPPPDAPAT